MAEPIIATDLKTIELEPGRYYARLTFATDAADHAVRLPPEFLLHLAEGALSLAPQMGANQSGNTVARTFERTRNRARIAFGQQAFINFTLTRTDLDKLTDAHRPKHAHC